MSRNAETREEFAGELRTFCLNIDALERVQESCDAGPGVIAERLAPFVLHAAEQRLARERGQPPMDMILASATGRLGKWNIQDLRAPILEGLIGGGMAQNEATRLVRRYFDPGPYAQFIPTAYAIVLASIVGVEDEQPAGEPSGEGDGVSRPSPEEKSASA